MPKRTFQPNVRRRAKTIGFRAKMKTPGADESLKAAAKKAAGNSSLNKHRFRWDERLHSKADYRRVYKEGRRYSTSGLAVWIFRHEDAAAPGHSRLGLAIPKTYGNAVARNRLKRLIREAFRLNKDRLPAGVDMVFSAKSSLPNPRYQTVEPLILKLWTLAKLQQPSQGS